MEKFMSLDEMSKAFFEHADTPYKIRLHYFKVLRQSLYYNVVMDMETPMTQELMTLWMSRQYQFYKEDLKKYSYLESKHLSKFFYKLKQMYFKRYGVEFEPLEK